MFINELLEEDVMIIGLDSVLSKIGLDFNAGQRLPAECSQAGREYAVFLPKGSGIDNLLLEHQIGIV